MVKFLCGTFVGTVFTTAIVGGLILLEFYKLSYGELLEIKEKLQSIEGANEGTPEYGYSVK